MQIRYQGKEDNHIWAYSDGANLEECLRYCQEKGFPYTSLRFETDNDAGCVIIMAPEIEGHEKDHEFLIEYIRKHMTIFSEDLISKIKLT